MDKTIDLTVQTLTLGRGESLAIPDEFRDALSLGGGGTYTVVRFNDLLLLYPRPLASLQALEQMRRVLEGEGVTLDELLSGLDEIRQEMYDFPLPKKLLRAPKRLPLKMPRSWRLRWQLNRIGWSRLMRGTL